MTLVAIGLDSAEPSMVESLMESGDLPTLAKLKERGCYGHLENFDVFTAELPWTTFATGVKPETTGYWTPLKYSSDYSVTTRAAYEYDEFPPFFALGDQYKVCCFDVPQVRIHEDLNGIQINAWGAHSPQVLCESKPSHLYEEIAAVYGIHPGLHADYANALSMDAVKTVFDRLQEGISLRGQVAADLVQRTDWDLFISVFGEPHGAGHNFWQLEPGHPLCGMSIPGADQLPARPMKETLISIDTAIAKIVDAAPEDATFVIFSAHGMGPNSMDLPSTFFLPELLYRWNYGKPALGVVDGDDIFLQQDWGTWTRHVWNTCGKGGVLRRLARKVLPTRLYNPWAKLFEYDRPDFPICPVNAERRYAGIPCWMPTIWYANCWPKMKAFALSSFSEGYIRVNVAGREKQGIVQPEDYQSVLDEIKALLQGLRCARTGERMVTKVIQMRSDPMDLDPKLSDADLVVAWQEKYASDSVVHPTLGKIGPVPHFRAGSHRHTGFLLASGSGVPKGAIKEGHALDLAPTLLTLLGAPVPEYMEGKSLLPRTRKSCRKERMSENA